MNFNEQAGKAWLRANVSRLVPANTREYKSSTLTLRLGTNMLGMHVDLPPVEGTVVHAGDDFYAVKTARTAFSIVDPTLLPAPLAEGSKVRITPYQRRRFDGTRFSEPESTEQRDGYVVKTMLIGKSVSDIPVPKPATEYTEHMLDLLHRAKCPDGVRLISNMLVDFNARNIELQEPVLTGQPDEWRDPQFKFDCETAKFAGRVIIGLDIAADVYYVELQKPDPDGAMATVSRCATVYFDQMAEVLETLLCDGKWKIATVDLLKAAPKVKTAAAAEA